MQHVWSVNSDITNNRGHWNHSC